MSKFQSPTEPGQLGPDQQQNPQGQPLSYPPQQETEYSQHPLQQQPVYQYGNQQQPYLQYPMQPPPQPYMQPQPPYPYQQSMSPPGVQVNAYIQQPYPMMMPNNIVQVNVQQHKTSFLVRALYFIFIGSWFGFFWLNLGFLLCVFIVTLPLGLAMLNRLPTVLTLRPAESRVNIMTTSSAFGTMTTINVGGTRQYSFLMRALYFLFIGFWVGYFWALLGYMCCLTIVLLPIGLMMLNRLPAVITLRKN